MNGYELHCMTANYERSYLIKLLAAMIYKEANDNPDYETPEPYRAAGDRLVDEALAFVD